jgi:hypothetical protein
MLKKNLGGWNMINKIKNSRFFISTGIFLTALWMGGCATGGLPPTEGIASAEMAINVAREGNAIIHAPLELKLAEDKLNAAKAAVEEKEFHRAQRLTEEALLDAKVAEAKSSSEKSKRLTREMRESIEALRREIGRTQK